MHNIEIKAYCQNLAAAHEMAQQVAKEYLGQDHQIDTYFCVPRGRMKFRESSLSGITQLIPYLRPDQASEKVSHYTLITIDDPAHTKQLLTSIFGIDVVVDKRRDIYLIGKNRIHIDQVQGLGTFIEFEAPYHEEVEGAKEQAKAVVRQLMEQFGVCAEDLIEVSYREMVKAMQK